MTKRPSMSAAFKVKCLLYSAIERGTPFTCIECGDDIGPEHAVQFDHRQALIHEGAHDYRQVKIVHTECHKKKTKRDVQANAKVKRLTRGKKRRGREIPSRPFQKRPKKNETTKT